MKDALLTDSVDRLLRGISTPEAVRAAELTGWAPQLWASAAEMGLPWISLPEDQGGSGGTLQDALEVLRIAGRHALPLPLAETGMLAGWLLSSAGLPFDRHPMAIVPRRPEDRLELRGGRLWGRVHRVPWARVAERIVVLVPDGEGWVVAMTHVRPAGVLPSVNMAGEPRDTVDLEGETVDVAPLPQHIDADALRLRGALSRVALMTGALARMSELAIEYCGERNQFGKPIGSFQGVQAHLVHAAQETAITELALEAASLAALRPAAEFEIAAAKIVACRAATTATRAAHQTHGAMGLTQEYALHLYSRRLWAWREEYGTEQEWAQRLGVMAAEVGADKLYPLITRSAEETLGDS